MSRVGSLTQGARSTATLGYVAPRFQREEPCGLTNNPDRVAKVATGITAQLNPSDWRYDRVSRDP